MSSTDHPRRTMDAAFLNAVVNHPEVRPGLGGAGPLDLSEMLADPRNIALVNDHGGFILTPIAPAVYESHSQFLPEGRGPGVVALMRAGFRYLFTETDCFRVVTKVPADNPAALGLARAAGFTRLFDRKAAWPTADGGHVGVGHFDLTLERWVGRDDVVEKVGADFHDQLEAAKRAAGSELPTHPDDEAHDRAAGAAVLMAKAGNAAKAVVTYNAFALLAGYAPIQLLSTTPPIIDAQDAVVGLRGSDMEILLCR